MKERGENEQEFSKLKDKGWEQPRCMVVQIAILLTCSASFF